MRATEAGNIEGSTNGQNRHDAAQYCNWDTNIRPSDKDDEHGGYGHTAKEPTTGTWSKEYYDPDNPKYKNGLCFVADLEKRQHEKMEYGDVYYRDARTHIAMHVPKRKFWSDADPDLCTPNLYPDYGAMDDYVGRYSIDTDNVTEDFDQDKLKRKDSGYDDHVNSEYDEDGLLTNANIFLCS